MRHVSAILAFTRFLATVSVFGQEAPADFVLRNGKLVTVDASRPEAEALAARDGVLIAVGTDAEISRWIGPDTEVPNLDTIVGGEVKIGSASRPPEERR